MRKSFILKFKEQKIRSDSVKIKNLRVSKTKRISISNYNSNKINEKIRRIHQTFASYHSTNIKRTNELILNTQKSISKKNLILSLKEDLEYHKKINDSYLAYEKYAEDLCKSYKKNFDDIFIYKKDLTEDLKDFINLLKSFEENKINLINEKKLIRQSNEDILKYKLEEQNKLNNEIIKLSKDLEKQSDVLKDLNAILKFNLSMNQNNLMEIQNEELKYKDKLEKMENAYKKLIYKYNYYQDMTVLERRKKFAGDNSFNKEETDEASIKLKEEVIKNNYLKKEIDALKNKMKEFEKLDASKFRKFRFNMTKDNKERKGSKERTGSKESKNLGLFLRGGDNPTGGNTTPGFATSWSPKDLDKAILFTEDTTNDNYIFYIVSWKITKALYFMPLAGLMDPDTIKEDGKYQGPQYTCNAQNRWVSFYTGYPAQPGTYLEILNDQGNSVNFEVGDPGKAQKLR